MTNYEEKNSNSVAGGKSRANTVKAVIFDLDGTLTDTLEDLTDATNYALGQVEMPLRTLEEIRTFVGDGVAMLVKRALGERQDKFATAYEEFRRYYKKHLLDKTKAYAGAHELLAWLKNKGIKTAVVSNKYDVAVKRITKKIFGKGINKAVGTSKSIKPKPSVDGINRALKLLKVTAQETVFVGDSEVDFATAKNAGLRFVGAGWGFGCITSPSVIAKTPLEIIQILADDIPEIFTIS